MGLKKFLAASSLFLLVIAGATPTKATHLMGADISYICINNCTIEVHLRVYRDCSGASGVQQQSFSFNGGPGCTPPTQVGAWQPGPNPGQTSGWQITEVTPVCPGTVTQCQNPGSPVRGVEEYHRWARFNICTTNCNSYTIEWWGQARNGGITSGAANQGLGSFITTINTALTTCNNSPQFNNPPVPYLCEGQPFTFNQGAVDPDGDSLSYTLGPCYTNTNAIVNYNAGYSPTSPLGSTWNVVMNPVSGDVSFTPNPGNIVVGVMCVYVQEWRNGVMINQIVRDMQINVISCPSNSQPVANNVSSIQNGFGQGNSSTGIFIGTCAGNNLCFDIPLFDANPADSILAWWNFGIPTGQFFLTGNPTIRDTITGINPSATFCWTPTSAGTFSFLVNMRDNACPNFGFSQFTVTIQVSNPQPSAFVQSINCDTATLCGIVTNAVPPVTYSWTGQAGLSGNTQCVSNVYPGPGNYTYTLTVTDSFGCVRSFNSTVSLPNLPLANAGQDRLFCMSTTGTIGSAPQPNMTYSWSPTTGLSNPNSSNPSISVTNPGPGLQTISYILTVTSNVTGCSSRDTVNVSISYPAQLSIVPDHIECFATPTGGADLTVTNGMPGYTYSWVGPNGFFASTQDITGVYAGMYYISVMDSAGCVSRDSILITQPAAPVWVNLIPRDICCNGSNDGLVDATVTGASPPFSFIWAGPSGFSAATEDINGLAPGMYYVTVTDQAGCSVSDSVRINTPPPVIISFNTYNVACNGEANGIVAATAVGGYGNFGYQWIPGGQTTDSISGLSAGPYQLIVSDTCFADSIVTLFFDDFEGYSPWSLNVQTGPNGLDRNFWRINDGEGGVAPGGCATVNNGDNTLHIVRISSPNGRAIYDMGGSCGAGSCPTTNMRAESPWISTLGYANLTLEFDFISVGDGLLDNASVWYNAGAGWNVLNPSIKSLTCTPGQGLWTRVAMTLPAAANNVPALQIAFNWTNNDDGIGANPSIAVNNVRVIAPRLFPPTVCTTSGVAVVNQPAVLRDTIVAVHNLCFGQTMGQASVIPSGGNGNYSYFWSTGSNSAAISNLPAGTYYVTVTDTAYTPAGGPAGYLTCVRTDSIVITQPAQLTTAATGTPTSCFMGSNGTVMANPAGGTPGYQYVWNTTPIQTTQTATGLPTGSYSVTVTDANGCTATAFAVVSQPSPISVSMSQTNARCGDPNGTATATAAGGTPGYTYAWGTNPVQTTQTATGLLPGLVQVTVTDANGCQSFGQIIVGNEPRPRLNMDGLRDPDCFGGSNGWAMVSASGGRPPYTFAWSNGQTGQTATGLSAGQYTVIVTDFFGCRDTMVITIGSPPPVGGSIIVQHMGCNSVVPDGTIGVLPTGGTPGYTYVWSTVPQQTTQMATGLAPGIYFVTISDSRGCTYVTSDTVRQIPRPDVTAGPGVAFCEGEGGAMIFATGSGGLAPYWYSWWCDSTNTFCGLDSLNDDDPIANPDTSTWYYVFITDQNGCRSDTDSVFVTVMPKPIVDAGPDRYICGDSAPCTILMPIITGAPGPYTYNWSPGAFLNDSTIMNPCARPDTTIIYTLIVTAGNGCTSDFTTTDTMSSVTVSVGPIPIAEAGPDKDICYGDTVMLQGYGYNAGPVYKFEWSPAIGLSDSAIANPLAFPAITSTYTLVVWSNGCPSYADTAQVRVHTIPTVEAGWDREICLGDTAFLDGQAGGDSTATYTYLWLPNTGIIGSNLTEDIYANPVSTTTYYFWSTTNWGCKSAPDSATVYLKPSPHAEAGPNLTICGGDSIVLQGSYFYTTTDTAPNASQVWFTWTPNQNLNDSTLIQPTVWPAGSMWYHLNVRYNTCSTDDSVLVTVIPGMVATYDSDTTVICGKDSVQLYSSGGLGGATFTWTPPTGLSNPNIANPMASPDTTTTYTVTISEGGCEDSGSLTIEVVPVPKAAYLNSLPEGCPPHAVNFISTSEGAINYIWLFGDDSVSNMQFPTHVYNTPGVYVVTLIAESYGGCADTVATTTVTVLDTAKADFLSNPSFPVEMYLPATNVQFTNLSSGAAIYNWTFGDGINSDEINPAHLYATPGEYFVTLNVTNAFGCHSKVTKGPFVVMAPDLFIPNVFSPNGDGINDVFLINYTGSQPFNLQIFDRWGVLLYQSNNKTEGWDGTNQKGAGVADGVYYYHVTIGGKKYSGPVTLIR